MAKVEFINSILSGKLGGSVYARNRGGAYVRAYARNINPNTDAQNGARNSFGVASSSYHTLTPEQKSLWNEFASIYTGRKGTPGSRLSGFNAYIAVCNTVQNMNRLWTGGVDLAGENGGTPFTITQQPFVFDPNTIPAELLLPNIKTTTGGLNPNLVKPIPAFMDDATIANSTLGVIVNIPVGLSGGSPSAPFEVGVGLRDANSLLYGFGVYISKGVKQKGMFIPNPEEILVGVQRPTNWGATVEIDRNLWLSGEFQRDKSTYQAWPVTGETVRMSVYQISQNGMHNKIYSHDLVLG
jgi:hypothetical protein